MSRILLPLVLVLTAVLAVSLAILAVASPAAARGAVVSMLREVAPGSWVDVLRSRLVA